MNRTPVAPQDWIICVPTHAAVPSPGPRRVGSAVLGQEHSDTLSLAPIGASAQVAAVLPRLMISGAHWLARTEQDDLGLLSRADRLVIWIRKLSLRSSSSPISLGGPGSTASRLDGPGDPAVQARQVFENLRRCPAAAGAGFCDVVKMTFLVLGAADLPAVRAARHAVIDTDRPPASTAVQVDALFAPGYLLEVEAWGLAGD